MRKILFPFLILLISCISCIEDPLQNQQNNTLVPYVELRGVSLQDPVLLNTPGEFRIINNQGYLGIIVFNINNRLFKAFDLGTPYINPENCNQPMMVNSKSGEMSSSCISDNFSFSQFKTFVTIDNTEYHLREYHAFLDGGV